MVALIGILVVVGAIAAGYVMENGKLLVLLQPAELVIILGAAIGTVLIANPLHILKQIIGGMIGVFGGSKFTKQRYLDSLKMMFELLNKARREGLMSLEADVEDLHGSYGSTGHASGTRDEGQGLTAERRGEPGWAPRLRRHPGSAAGDLQAGGG